MNSRRSESCLKTEGHKCPTDFSSDADVKVQNEQNFESPLEQERQKMRF